MAKQSVRDEDFYGSLAAGVSDDDSDLSGADAKAMASSLKGLDDMDDDILSSLTSKKKPLSQTLPAKSTAKPKETPKVAATSTKSPKSTFNIDDIMADDDPLDSILAKKTRPKTTDETKKSSITSDLFGGSPKQRPATTDQPKKQAKKFDFGDFDEDDPLAGLDLSDDDGDAKPKATKKPSAATSSTTLTDTGSTPRTISTAEAMSIALASVSDHSISEAGYPQPAAMAQGNEACDGVLNESIGFDTFAADRPVTRSGARSKGQEVEADPLPVKMRSKASKDTGSDDGSDWDKSSDGSDTNPAAASPATASPAAATTSVPAAPSKPSVKKDDVVFSDDDDLDLGLDDSPKKIQTKNMASSLFDKPNTVQSQLQRPGTGDSQKEFVLDKKYTTPAATTASTPASTKKPSAPDDEDDVFGSYAPSVLSSRPGTGRSVRFEDEEPEKQRPATAGAAAKRVDDDDWLGLASGNRQQKRPLGLASTIDFSSGGGDDWLDMAVSSNSRPKTAPDKIVDKKPPRTPLKSSKGTPAPKAGDDWLAELTAKVDEETEQSLKPVLSRQNSAERITSRQSSLDSTGRGGGPKPILTKQKSADDWLGLGDETPIEVGGSKSSTMPLPKTKAGGDSSDWLGLGAGPLTKDTDSDAENWIKAAKSRRGSSQSGEPAASKPVVRKSKDRADERSLDILRDDKPAAASKSKLPWDDNTAPAPADAGSLAKPQTPKQSIISSIFADDEPDVTRQATSAPPAQLSSTPKRAPVSSPALTQPLLPQPVFQPMFVSPQTSALGPATSGLSYPALNAGSWQSEQDSLVAQHQAQVEQLQQQFNQMMEMKRQQQQAAIEQQQKIVEETFRLQQQNLQASMSSLGPSPVFPVGLTPTKQSEIQLNNVELEGKVRRLEHEKHHLESIINSMKQRHAEETGALETSSKSRILIVEESYQRREARLREEIEQLTNENLHRLRMIEEEKVSLMSAQYRKLDESEQRKASEIEKLRQQHYRDIEDLKNDHQMALDRVKKSKQQELEALSTAQGNPNSLQFLLEQMKQNAAGLTQMQFQIGKTHQLTMDERELALNTRDQQLKVLQECLSKQQEENDKERSRLQELLAKMEIQLREQERQLHQERWSVSQEKSKLSALQTSVEQERQLLNEQLARERSELSRAKDSFLAEQRSAMVQLADERRLLSEERAQLTVRQRLTEERESSESLRQSQGSAKYDGLIKALENERETQTQRSKTLAEDEKKVATESATIQQEKEAIRKEQQRLAELAQRVQAEMDKVDKLSKECLGKEQEGMSALYEARRIEASNHSRLSDINGRLDELKAFEKRAAEERLQLAAERKQMETLKTMQLCAGCKNPLSRNPFFSLSTPILKNRGSAPSVGVVSPQKFDMADPTIIHYKIQADQDDDFLNEESVYLQALKLSPYHK